MTNILFVCSRNKWRSPTAEQIFSNRQNISTASAGTNKDAENVVCIDDIEWADAIFAMEKKHLLELKRKFGGLLHGVALHCLNIKDNFEFMDPRLVFELETKFAKYAALYSH